MKNASRFGAVKLVLSEHEDWSADFWHSLVPLKDKIAKHPFFQDMATGHLDLACFRYALLNFYPLIANFPAYMGLTLTKATELDAPGVAESRDWLIHNIKIEANHLRWYSDWATSFGLKSAELESVTPPPAMNAINHFLWNINQRGSVAEGLAATNLAIEWATGDWSAHVYAGIEHYANRDGVTISQRTVAWLRAHAHYDDLHPYEAMELIKRLCDHDPEQQKKALAAATEGMHYYLMALDDCYRLQSARQQ